MERVSCLSLVLALSPLQRMQPVRSHGKVWTMIFPAKVSLKTIVWKAESRPYEPHYMKKSDLAKKIISKNIVTSLTRIRVAILTALIAMAKFKGRKAPNYATEALDSKKAPGPN